MKKFLLILSLGLFVFGCEQPEKPVPDPLPVEDNSIKMPFDNGAATKTLTIESESKIWRAIKEDNSIDWFSVKKSAGGSDIEVTVKLNPGVERKAKIKIDLQGTIIETITVIQSPVDDKTYYRDGEVVQLRKATKGNGIDLVVMGEGYVLADMVRDGSGKYENVMKQAAEGLFSVYPYTAYKDYFNVWMVAATSYEAGMSVATPQAKVDTKFKSEWVGQGYGTEISCDQKVMFDYAHLVADPRGKDINTLTVIMPVNMDVWAGTCFMDPDGFSCALIPVGEKLGVVVTHEIGGHGFAKLCDEYYTQYYPDEEITDKLKAEVTEWKSAGHYPNIDLHGNIAETTWKAFAGKPGYEMVGVYEGAYMYGKGVWRPEENSCMNDNTPYFNAPSRYAQLKRIMALSGEDTDYTVEEFMRDDAKPAYPTGTRASSEQFVPLARPVIIRVQR